VAGAAPVNRGIELVRGEWFTQIDDDDEFNTDHIEVLLGHALQGKFDLAYGKVLLELDDGDWMEIGSFPPRWGDISHMCALYHSTLRMFQYDSDCWKLGEPGDWNRWRRMKEAGVKMGFVDRVVGVHYRLRSRFNE
jgi:glycosyltransferase involved in cell wall biosynthesis